MENEEQLRILYLYQILLDHSDADHPLRSHQLMGSMEEKYQIKVHRTRIPEYVRALNSRELEVMTQTAFGEKEYYQNDRSFEISEIKLLIDEVGSSENTCGLHRIVDLRLLGRELQHPFRPAESHQGGTQPLKYMTKSTALFPDIEIVRAILARITWYHNIALMDKANDTE